MTDNNTAEKPSRIAKVIAQAGICSRREAERMIAAGKVTLNGELLDTPAITVTSKDIITVNGETLDTGEKEVLLFKFYKPKGYLCTNYDPQGRETIFDLLPNNLPRLISVGRLDLNSEGLLLLTTDNKLATDLMQPSQDIARTYRVRISGTLTDNEIQQLSTGLTIDGMRYRPIKITLDGGRDDKRNQWITMTLHEGKNREIRTIMEHFDLQVSRLIRTEYANISLGKMNKSELLEIPHNKIKQLKVLIKSDK